MKKSVKFERLDDSLFKGLSKKQCASVYGGIKKTYMDIATFDPASGTTIFDQIVVDDSPH
ncbi:MAG: hypothetical protein GTO45_31040 [Candidatus Aminicenantes bacterium]|nr:hypothetical protein [Candidatus Aminicenantes bacterium]NIM84547.1 hypothetical protein [Candidatus Aminicenantes bacterium]NIN22605.1 hypothetical protein [Candidatus Aminicenantes bacterium]NIN46367.1 hypothetical protein [Candidatus Aminicenantes bacterium]NIN89215.1 hypothetical protein [Candidatus Aminicenantes bacterium]